MQFYYIPDLFCVLLCVFLCTDHFVMMPLTLPLFTKLFTTFFSLNISSIYITCTWKCKPNTLIWIWLNKFLSVSLNPWNTMQNPKLQDGQQFLTYLTWHKRVPYLTLTVGVSEDIRLSRVSSISLCSFSQCEYIYLYLSE